MRAVDGSLARELGTKLVVRIALVHGMGRHHGGKGKKGGKKKVAFHLRFRNGE